ncbi:MAG: response regulator [SAR324 cluster bacterium]|nr:response regulator [SAR324 cluster bacterium]
MEHLEKLKILVLDDETDLWETIQDALKREPYELHFAKNGREGLERFYEVKPIAVLLDLRMPVMDGFAFLDKLRPNREDPYFVLVLSGHGDDDDVKAAYQLGAQGFLRKPFNVFELRGILKQNIDLKQTQNHSKQELQRLYQEQLQEAARLKAEQEISAFFSSVFYFVLENLEERSPEEILASIESFLRDEMRLDVAVILDSRQQLNTFNTVEKELLLNAEAEGELIFREGGYLICLIRPLYVLIRNPPDDFDQDKLHTFVSTAASRLGFAIAQDSKRIMHEVFEEAVLLINSLGEIEPGFTDICLKLFHIADKGTFLQTTPGTLMYGNTPDAEHFQEWLRLCFEGALDFMDMRALQPAEMKSPDHKILEIEMIPIRDKDQSLKFILIKFKDVTALREQQVEIEHQQHVQLATLKVIKNRTAFLNYYRLVMDSFSSQDAILSVPHTDLIRSLHTAKGMSGVFYLKGIQQKCHDAETLLKLEPTLSPGSSVIELIQSIADWLQDFINKEVLHWVLGEDDRSFTVDKNWFLHIQRQFQVQTVFTQNRVQHLLRQITFIPLISLFKHFETVLQDLAVARGKSLYPLMINDDSGIFVPPKVLDNLINSMSHLFRNAVDHGIETPETRTMLDKNEMGRIDLHLESDATHLIIRVSDDGQGIDQNKLLKHAVSKNLISAEKATTLNKDEIRHLVFWEGLSTKEEVDLVSGRGVGMSDVRASCRELGGTIDYQTGIGKGTIWTIALPLERIYGELFSPEYYALNMVDSVPEKSGVGPVFGHKL